MQEITTAQSTGHAVGRETRRNLRAICWRLRRGASHATCSLHGDVTRWQLRLEIDGRLERQKTFDNLGTWVPTALEWKAGLSVNGWQERD